MGQVEAKDLASSGDMKLLHAVQDVQRGLAKNRLLRCVLSWAVLDSVLSKKLLRAFATLSSGAVVPPVERWGRRRRRR